MPGSNSSTPAANICPAGTYSASGWTACQNCRSVSICAVLCSNIPLAVHYWINNIDLAFCVCVCLYEFVYVSVDVCSGGYLCVLVTVSWCVYVCVWCVGVVCACSAGYLCLPGSVTASPNTSVCPAGSYSGAGDPRCSPCTDGYYGAVSGAVNSTCSGVCSPGYTCTGGATSPQQSPCPAGQYSLGGAATCSPCLPGYVIL